MPDYASMELDELLAANEELMQRKEEIRAEQHVLRPFLNAALAIVPNEENLQVLGE